MLYLCARFGKHSQSLRTMETTYEFILRLKHAQCWEGCKCLFPQAETLDRYFQAYELMLQLEPDKKRGYQSRWLANPKIRHLLGKPDRSLLKWAIFEMTKRVDIQRVKK